ncbi:MAG: hypothetical protein Q8O13_08040 [Candidatus Omnitrophota bacterium]|nr:hypothetical protein [Candidatus Omnitrophota bacterium]
MDAKKWSILAQILIALGCLSGLRGIIWGLSNKSVLDIIFGLAGLIIFWSVYKFKTWALTGLTVVLSLNIIFTLFGIFGGLPLIIGVIVIALNGFIIYYFNSQTIKNLFLS